MSTELFELFKEAVDVLDADGHESEVREFYSGRGMFGATCPAIVSNASGAQVGAAIAIARFNIGHDNGEDVFEIIEQVWSLIPKRSDNMGLSMVYY